MPSLLLALACAPAGELRDAARAPRLGELRDQLTARRGELSLPTLRRVARSLLEGELERSRGQEGVALVESLRACARPLEASLKERALRGEAPGGAAALLYQSSIQADFLVDEQHGPRTERHYRAAFARSLTAAPALRRPFLRDGDPLVRRAALDAALERPDPADLGEILEISRVDPDDLCRSKALRWLGTRSAAQGLPVLVDRYRAGDEKQRLFALGGLASLAQHDLESELFLYHIALTDRGRVGLEASFLLLALPVGAPANASKPRASQKAGANERPHGGGLDRADRSSRLRERLFEYARSGALDERMSVLSRTSESTPRWRDVARANTDPLGGPLAVVAWDRLLEFSGTHREAMLALFELASQPGALQAAARRALASRGVVRLVPLLERDLNHRDTQVRREAADNLLTLGRIQSVAPLLADNDRSLRVEIACQLLSE